MITAYKIDNVWIGLEFSDDGIALELQDYFSFLVPGYKFKKQYRDGVWDGRIKLFNPWQRRLYAGLLPQLKKFCSQFGYQLTVDPKLYTAQQITPEEIQTFIESLNVTRKGEPLSARYYQKVGLYYMINAKRTVLVSPTASGKSLMIYMFARWFFDSIGGRIALIVPTTGLVEQMASDFSDYSQGTFDHNVHKIYSGKEKNDASKAIYISTWQSLYELPKGYFDQFDVVIIDECHGAQASSLKSILEKSQAEYRHGLTGTMHEPEAHKWVIEGLLGEVVDLVSLEELMKRKWIANLKVNCITFDHTEENKKALRSASYHEEIDYLVNCQERTDAIVKATGKQKENAFILFERIEHGKRIKESVERQFPGRKVYLVYGSTEVEDREMIRKILEKEYGSIVVASYRVFSTGISINNLYHIFFAHPSKSKFRVFQSIGRSLRLHKDKEYATLWDFSDKLTNDKTRLNHTMRHFVERVRMYSKEGLDYKMIKVNLESKI